MNKDLTEFLSEKESKYITDCWKSFTALTEAEEENLKKIIGQIKFKNTVIASVKPEAILKTNKQPRTNSKKVICIETGEIFESLANAARYLGVGSSHISNCIKYGYRVKGQYHFKFTDKQQEKKKILWITLR